MSAQENTSQPTTKADTKANTKANTKDLALFTIAHKELTRELAGESAAGNGQILALGWSGATDRCEHVDHLASALDLSTKPPAQGAYTAALWRVPETKAPANARAAPDPTETVRTLHSVLSAKAALVVAVPLIAMPSAALPAVAVPVIATLVVSVPITGTATAESPQGLLPNGRQELLRSIVGVLLESGFSIHKEKHVAKGASATSSSQNQIEGSQIEGSQIEGWHLLVARPNPFSIRSYRAGDEEAILHLFPSCFFVQRSSEHWHWKYAENPWGNHQISVATAPDGALAAHYAGYSMPFWYKDKGGAPRTFQALQMGDTMTHPDYRNTGRGKNSLLARTVRHFFALRRGGPYGFFYGFNTGPIQRFCSWFIGGSRVKPVGFWTRDCTPPPAKPRGYRIERVHHTEISFDQLFRRAAPHYRFLVKRDAQYVDWRYLRCPDAEFVVLTARRWGRLVAWSVFRRQENRLLWGDSLFRPRHTLAAAALLRAALTLPQHAGVERVEAWFPERPTWWSQTVESLGFQRQPHPDGLALMALPDSEEATVEQLNDLYYTLGDSDLF
jgi:hypothetical protein